MLYSYYFISGDMEDVRKMVVCLLMCMCETKHPIKLADIDGGGKTDSVTPVLDQPHHQWSHKALHH